MKEKSGTCVSKLCAEMQDVVTPRMGKLMTKQVAVAATCLANVNSTWKICKGQNCKVCEEYMTGPQKLLLVQGKRMIVFHVKMRIGDEDECTLQHCSLGPDWESLHSTIPRMKHTRIVTAEEMGNGFFLFICSCGYGFRYQCTCRHVAMILIHASGNVCAGCELDNIALRNTAAFAACRDASLIKRTARDWKVTLCSHVTEELLRICPGIDDDDADDADDADQRDDHNDGDQEQGQTQKRTRRTEDEQRLKSERDAKIQELQDKFYRIKAKLEVAASRQVAEFWTHASNVDGHLLAAFESLSGVPEAARSVVAHRYRDDPKRSARPSVSRAHAAGGGSAHRAGAAGGGSVRTAISATDGGPVSTSTSAPRHVVITISDSEELQELLEGGAPSDSE